MILLWCQKPGIPAKNHCLIFCSLVEKKVVILHGNFCREMISGNSSVDRALAFQAKGRGFESRLPLKNEMEFGSEISVPGSCFVVFKAGVAQG